MIVWPDRMERDFGGYALWVLEGAVAQEMHDLISDRPRVDHGGVGDGHDNMVALPSEVGGADTNLAVVGRAKYPVGCHAVHGLVARNDSQRIVDGAQRRLDRWEPSGPQQVAGMVEDRAIQSQTIQKVGDLTAAIGCAQHDDATEPDGTMAGDISAQYEAAHGMTYAMDAGGMGDWRRCEAIVQMVQHALERPAPTRVTDIRDDVAGFTQTTREQGCLEMMAAEAVEEDDAFSHRHSRRHRAVHMSRFRSCGA